MPCLNRLKEPCKINGIFNFLDPGPGGSGGPREGPPWDFPGPPGASRRPSGPETNQSKKPRNLKELIKQEPR